MSEHPTFRWVVHIVPPSEVEHLLNDLEAKHPPAGAPIICFIDQTRVIVSWRYSA